MDDLSGALKAEDFRRLFQAVPSPCLVLLPDAPRFTIAAVTDAYLAATRTRRDELLGRGLFEVFPDNPDDPSASGVHDLLVSLERVLATRSADVMGVQKYDIPRPDGLPGFELKYWSPINTPILDADGSVAHIVHRVEDATDWVLIGGKAASGERRPPDQEAEAVLVRGVCELTASNRQLKVMNEHLRRSEARLNAALAVGRLGAWELDLTTGIFERSALYDQILGLSASCRVWRFQDVLLHILPEDRDRVAAGLNEAVEQGAVWSGECHIRRVDNGTLRWVQFQGRPLQDAAGRVTRLAGVLADVSEARRAAERQQLLLAELNHRVKNAFVTCQSMVVHSLKNASSLEQAREVLIARLVALGQAQDMLTQTGGSGALLAEVLQQTLAPFTTKDLSGTRLTVAGPEVALGPKAVVALHAAFHELATNAAKYGALSVPQGGVSVTWTIQDRDGASVVVLTWSEHGGPPVPDLRRRGFGSRLLERSVAGELGGKLAMEPRASGLNVEMEIPLSQWAWALRVADSTQ